MGTLSSSFSLEPQALIILVLKVTGTSTTPAASAGHLRLSCPHYPQPRRRVALFSANKWPCFQLSRFKQIGSTGPLLGKQVAPVSD
jgi:hypothetical protein